MFCCRLLTRGSWLRRIAQADLVAEALWEGMFLDPPLLQQQVQQPQQQVQQQQQQAQQQPKHPLESQQQQQGCTRCGAYFSINPGHPAAVCICSSSSSNPKQHDPLPGTSVKGAFLCPPKATKRCSCVDPAAAAAAAAAPATAERTERAAAAATPAAAAPPPRGLLLQCGAVIGSFLLHKIQLRPEHTPPANYGFW